MSTISLRMNKVHQRSQLRTIIFSDPIVGHCATLLVLIVISAVQKNS